MAQPRVSCGRDFHCSPDINLTLDEACRAGMDFVCMPIVNPRFKREFLDGPAKNRKGAITRSDMLLTSQDWSTLIVAKTSPWLDVDSKVNSIRRNSEKALSQELLYASHLSVPAILINLNSAYCMNLARIILSHITAGHNHLYWVRIPMVAPEDDLDDVIEQGQGEGQVEPKEPQDTWKWWNSLRMMCETSKKIGLALEISENIPAPEVVDRWFGEPIKCVFISTTLFLTNRKGFPVLSRAHQALVKRAFKLDAQVVFTGMERHPDRGFRTYQQYLEHMWQSQEPTDNVEKFAKGYEDYLQSPLQPLMDNLESQTYEVFEKDPVKYSQYQKAIYYALLDRIPIEEKESKTLVVMVLGAGRGPLVSASLNAASKADRKIRVYAVEKNPNAIVTLENLKYEVWGDQVDIVSCDMRMWNAPEKADIIVSELLGSFGDNELSPECLDGAQKFLKDDGISIPCLYTSYLAPLSSSKLWNGASICKDSMKPASSPFESPYVVRLHNVNILAEPKPLFTFEHPNRDVLIDNNRYEITEFDIDVDTVIHGFGGYFDCKLYKDVHISIVPQTHTPGMFSWFPVYFPIKEPMQVQKGDIVVSHFWRMCTDKNVWYEWTISEPLLRSISNPRGRSYQIGL